MLLSCLGDCSNVGFHYEVASCNVKDGLKHHLFLSFLLFACLCIYYHMISIFRNEYTTGLEVTISWVEDVLSHHLCCHFFFPSNTSISLDNDPSVS